MAPQLPLELSTRQQECDLCGHRHFQVVNHLDRRKRPLVTVVCHQCGLVSHEQIPDDETLDRYYRVQYRQDYHGEIAPAPHRVLRAWKGGQWLFHRLQPFVAPGSRVFEIGAGIGCTVKAFEFAGFRAGGIEPGNGFHRFAQDRMRARVQHGTLFDLPAAPNFDFVLLVHVIEHFNSPRRALQHIHSLLRNNGRLYVECPNLGAPHAAPGKQFHFAHIHNFTPDTLAMLAQRCGFEIVSWLTARQDRALRIVLQKAAAPQRSIAPEHDASIPESYERTLAALTRYTRVGYHVRPKYLLDRLHRDGRFMSHHVLAGPRLGRLLRRCQSRTPAIAKTSLSPSLSTVD